MAESFDEINLRVRLKRFGPGSWMASVQEGVAQPPLPVYAGTRAEAVEQVTDLLKRKLSEAKSPACR